MPSAPDPTTVVLTCLGCDDWQIDAPPRARAPFGIRGLLWAISEVAAEHQREAHPDTLDKPVTYRGAQLKMDSGRPANGGLAGIPLPRWWDWVTVKGTR